MIPTRNRHRLLAELLRGISAQDLGRELFEIIVVDDGSDPVVQVPSGVRLIRNPRRGLNAARNVGARAALSKLVCFVDDDVAVPREWLRELVAGSDRHPEASCFGGPIRVRMEVSAGRWMCARCAGGTAGESELDLGVGEGTVDGHVNGGNMGIRARALVDVGYFDERLPCYGEETEWEDRLRAVGGRIVYLPEAWLWHRRTAEHMRFRKRLIGRFRRGRGNAYYSRSIGHRIRIGPQRVLRLLAHAARRRCQGGLLHASWSIGFIVGSAQFANQTRRSQTLPDERRR